MLIKFNMRPKNEKLGYASGAHSQEHVLVCCFSDRWASQAYSRGATREQVRSDREGNGPSALLNDAKHLREQVVALQRRCAANDNQLGLGSCDGDVHATPVVEQSTPATSAPRLCDPRQWRRCASENGESVTAKVAVRTTETTA